MKIVRAGVFAVLFIAPCNVAAGAQTEPPAVPAAPAASAAAPATAAPAPPSAAEPPSAAASPSAATPAVPSPSPSAAASNLPEIGHVFTSDRRPEPISDTTRPTFVVDRRKIEDSGSRSISSALEYVPGLSVFSYGAFGSTSNLGIRGTTSTQTLVLRDGIPLNVGSLGSIDLGSLSTLGIARIEVVESGSSTLYGSSATGGVINLIGAAKAAAPYVRLSTGTLGDNDAALEAGTGGLIVSLERHVARNDYAYPAFAFPGTAAQPAGTRTNADALQSALRLAYSAKLASGWTARLSGGSDSTRLGVPGSLAFGATPDNRQETARSDAQVDLAHSAGAGTLSFTLAGSAQRLAYFDRSASGGESDTLDSRTQASLRYTVSATSVDLVTGVDLTRASGLLSSAGAFGFPQLGVAQSQAAAYAQFGYVPAANTRLTFGLRAENDSPHAAALSPSFGFSTGAGQARISANVAQSFRVPSFDELYYPAFGNPNLVPERLSNYDVTVAFPALAGGISLGYFGRSGANLISTVCDASFTCSPVNVSRAVVGGLQFTASSQPYNHVRVTTSVTNLYRALGFDGTDVRSRLPETPPLVATLGLERAFDGGPVAFGARVRVAGSRSSDGPLDPNPYDGFTKADAYVRYRLASHAIASLRVNNLGNERYEPIYGYPAPGRTLSFEFATR
jgi:vitamin B12 transporter